MVNFPLYVDDFQELGQKLRQQLKQQLGAETSHNMAIAPPLDVEMAQCHEST